MQILYGKYKNKLILCIFTQKLFMVKSGQIIIINLDEEKNS